MPTKKSASSEKKKSPAGAKNKSGVKNSLVNNINARKKAGTSRSKKESTILKKSYQKMQHDWKEKK